MVDDQKCSLVRSLDPDQFIIDVCSVSGHEAATQHLALSVRTVRVYQSIFVRSRSI